MSKKYKITSQTRLVKDEAGTKFHVNSDDYFGSIATILSLLRQQLQKNNSKNYLELEKTFINLESDLLFLQKNYQIKVKTHKSPRTKNKNNKPKGKLNNQ